MPRAYLSNLSGMTGRWLLAKANHILDTVAFFWVCLKVMVRFHGHGRRLTSRILVQQIYYTGVQSLDLVSLFAVLTGAILFMQGYEFLAKIGSTNALARLVIVVIGREIAPMLTAIIVIFRSGSAITMEIGYMNVLGEIEGLEMQGVSPYHYLCIPRLFGVMVSVICLVIWFDLAAIAAGVVTTWIFTDLTVSNLIYELVTSIRGADFLVVLAKGLFFGVTIPVVCLYHGFMAHDSITRVPPLTSRALVNCLLYVVFLNVILTVAYA
ncbi:MAG: ABC transporter permease [Proteobacteria bacterium]|nr:ABC transporter permease [Pseudomonadota bacterium]